MRSLKARLIVWVVAACIVLTAVGGLSLYILARAYLVSHLDAEVMHKARLLASMVTVDEGKLQLGFHDLDMGSFASQQAGGYLQVWFQGELIYRSPSLGDGDLPVEEATDDLETVAWMLLPRGRVGRGVVHRFEPRVEELEPGEPPDPPTDGWAIGDGDATVTLALTRDADEATAALGALRTGLIVVGAATTALLSLVIGYGVSRGMRPVDQLAAQVGRLNERSLDATLDVPRLPRELEPVVSQFNALLARLRVAFDRERRFTADIAHELRTPLAGLRTTLEVTLSKARPADDYALCLGQLFAVVKQMQVMVENLLHMAALEGGRASLAFEPVHVDSEIQVAWHAATGNGNGNGAAGKRYDATLSLHADRTITTDPALLDVVLRNILHNAVTYVNDGGRVEVVSTLLPDAVELRVVNSGSRVAAQDAARVFDRFWRGDASRTQTGAHFGLGLALVDLAVRAIGGTVAAHSQQGGDFTIVVRLPPGSHVG